MKWLLRISGLLLPTCRDVTRMLSQSSEARLSPAMRLKLAIHLRYCLFCRRFQEQLLRMSRMMQFANEHSSKEESELPQLPEPLVKRFQEAIQRENNL